MPTRMARSPAAISTLPAVHARAIRSVIAVLVVALVGPAGAAAALPKPEDPTIDVPSSIGGVTVKDRLKDADRAWGRSGKCDDAPGIETCSYASDDPLKGRAAIAAAVHKRVSSVSIKAGQDDEGAYVFTGRLMRFETPEGIGLGDPGKRIRKAYPEAIKTAGGTGFLIPGAGKSYMTVQTFAGKRITGITVVDGKHQG